jgi:O-acetyl-ADP-ribose deacetylase (regulator of RNase III)
MKFPPIVKTNQEPEYKIEPNLKISSVGVEIKKNSSQMPDGSALLTDTGSSSNLKNQGINYIIHAVPRHRNSCASDEEFIEIAVKAAQNSIILADREGIEKLAFCLIGGERYRGSCNPEKLAKGLVNGALNQLEKCQNLKRISFID